jgi:hypothetical protein
MISEWMKFVLAARRKKPGGSLFEIVVFIAIAVIYALSGIFKMRSKDKESKKLIQPPKQPRGEQIVPKRRYKPLAEPQSSPVGTRGPTQKALPYAKRIAPKQTVPSRQMRQVRAPQQPPQRAVPPTAKEVIRQILEPFFEPEKPPQRPQRPRPTRRRPAAKRTKTAEETARQDRMDKAQAATVKPPKAKAPAAPAVAVSQRPQFVSLEHLLQPDNLKMAIVYAEILGKPVGLRDM